MAEENITPHGEQGGADQAGGVDTSSVTDWKAKFEETLGHSRKWEQRAKENADAARRLADIESASKSVEQKNADRIAELEKSLAASERTALVARVQASHGISDADAALFLTGSDEAALTAQAKRLAERATTGPVSPREGNSHDSISDDPVREYARRLFNSKEE